MSQKKVVLNSKSREIVRNCLNICESEKEKCQLAVSLNSVQERVAKYTGISVSTVNRIKSEVKNLDNPDACLSTPNKKRRKKKI